MLSTLFAIALIFGASAVAQSPSVVCVAGQCTEGYSNTTIGITLSASGGPTSVLLLPGQYTSSTNPQLLHDLLTSSSATLSPSVGFSNSSSHPSVSLPLTVELQPGIAVYQQALYSGQGSYTGLSASTTNASTLDGSSLALSGNVWAEVSAGSNSRVILWNSVPDVSQLPQTASGSLSLINLQSTACSPPCAGNGVCSATGTCMCPTGFSGSSCETCAKGYYGPTCQPCPPGCTSCDDGMTGSGHCLAPIVSNPPSSCNCINGQCGGNGQCTCLPGWTSASNGTQCAVCASGFFLGSSGSCEICSLGCEECADGSGDCITCKSGYTQDASDRTLCDAPQQKTSSGATCPSGGYTAGSSCQQCAPECQTCTGSTSNDCVICASGSYSFNGSCVQTNSNGVCQGSSLIANNNKHSCDSCGPKCTSCQIPNFNVVSTINQAQCTGCLPGYVIYQGACVASCPSGTFLSPTDNLTCTACASSCSSCAGSANYCLTCSSNLLASEGSCVGSCPSNTFSSSGTCIPCHPDCATCSGSSFNQCTSCNKNLPVLTNNRCLATCSQNQYFDTTSSSCQSCDGSCASCSASGPNNCLACSSSNQVLRSGSCVAANCSSGGSVISGLGLCLDELVVVPSSSGTSPLPTIPGISTATKATTSLSWWEILLMTLGCAFIFVGCLYLWRRHARKKRAKETAAFASAKALDHKSNWRLRLARLGGKLFGHAPPKDTRPDSEEIALWKLRAAEEARHNRQLEKLIEDYALSGTSSPLEHDGVSVRDEASHRLSGHSLYAEVTGIPQRGPAPRQPVKTNALTSRFSTTTFGSVHKKPSLKRREPEPFPTHLLTDAEAYAESVRESAGGSCSLAPTNTGGSRNPFRK